MAHSPAQRRAKGGKPQYRSEPTTDEEIRQRRASANRVLTMLKAALNHAYDEGHVPNRDAWGRRLAPFEKVEVARMRSNSRGGGATDQRMRSRIPRAGARWVGNRMQVRRADQA